ncbi:rhodanese/Cell cycle control phosphatase superfamily protein isoform X2 [Tasmannia lanceolata]|uniref:rhodanese/Cell cycle control phosphatase superfamily protein isoform X2 n=1 Tax=Tasmannia lanceolata TaxID=3420 RepID=UPI0040629CA5
MLPVCSATPTSSSLSLAFSLLHKPIEVRCTVEERVLFGTRNGIHTQEISFKTHATNTNFLYANIAERSNQSASMEFADISSSPSELDHAVHRFSNECLYFEPQEWSNGSCPGAVDLHYVEASGISGQEELVLTNGFANDISNELNGQNIMGEPPTPSYSGDELLNLRDKLSQSTNVLSESETSESLSNIKTSMGMLLEKPKSVSGALEVANDALLNLKKNIDSFFSGINESIDNSIDEADTFVKNTYDTISLSLTNTVQYKLPDFTSEFKESIYKAGGIAFDVIRQAVVAVEDSLAKVSAFIIYSYGSTKAFLPPEIRNALNLSEERAVEALRPIKTVFEQANIYIEGLEKYLGLDPNDPIIPFILFLGSTTTLGQAYCSVDGCRISYWVINYGGYSGDLSPKSTLELLSMEENSVLIDVRPEDLRERDGVPDLRRGARFRYATVTLPEIDGSVRKLLKNGRDVDDALVAVVIRNLKIVQDMSKVIVMDSTGAQSKGIARSLRKLGLKRPYLVQGGFGSWVKDGLRIKENKPETALTILSEEAEAILEDIKPTPAKLIGYGVVLIAGIYAVIEWEKTLQFIAIVGLGQTVYRRLTSYESYEDLKQDVRTLVAPVRLGFSWAAGKLEPNKVGLPTSPSSTAVQSRVLQAAAKHESQPSDTEETKDPSHETATPTNENLDLSEA